MKFIKRNHSCLVLMNPTTLVLSVLVIFLHSKVIGAAENVDDFNTSLDFEQVLSSHQGIKDSFQEKMRAMFTQDNHEGSFSTHNQALVPDFKDDGNHFELGMQYFRKAEFKNAVQEFDKAAVTNPRYPHNYYYRGVSLILSDDFENGWKNIQKAQELGFKVRPRMLDNLRSYADTFGQNQVSPDMEKSFRKLQLSL